MKPSGCCPYRKARLPVGVRVVPCSGIFKEYFVNYVSRSSAWPWRHDETGAAVVGRPRHQEESG